MELREEVKAYRVTLMCDNCKNGEMLPNGRRLLMSPVTFPHVCNKCGNVKNISGKEYPVIEYEVVQQ